MMGQFDDHPTVVVLEYALQRLIIQDCLRTSQPAQQLAVWIDVIKGQGERYRQAFVSELKADNQAENALNALHIAGAFDTFAEDVNAGFIAMQGNLQV